MACKSTAALRQDAGDNGNTAIWDFRERDREGKRHFNV